MRDESKFDRLLAFGEALPTLRTRLAADLALAGVPRERVLATVIWIIDETLMRVGNEEYARTNDSYGATTLRADHVEIDGAEVLVAFRGKHGKEHRSGFRDRRIAAILRRCQELPGESLFTYLDELGEVRGVDSGDVNDYLREIAGETFTVKDFRTWGGSVRCFQLLSTAGEATDERDRQALVSGAVKEVAAHLGNTPAVARSSYVHPGILTAFGNGALQVTAALSHTNLDPEEARFVAFLRALAAAQPAARAARAS